MRDRIDAEREAKPRPAPKALWGEHERWHWWGHWWSGGTDGGTDIFIM